MQLGTLLSRFDDESVVLETLLAMDDLALMSRVQTAAEGAGTDVGSWAHEAVGRFIATADDERWLGLIGACSNTTDPGLVALRRMLESALQAHAHVCR
jgi:hypothetical protein